MAKKNLKLKGVDFSNVQEGGGIRLKPGEYVFKIVDIEIEKKDGNPVIVVTNEVVHGVDKAAKGKKMKLWLYTTEKALWKLRNWLIALGINVPKKVQDIDFAKCIGKYFGAVIEDEKYEGKTKSVMVDFFEVKKTKSGKWEKTAGADDDEDIDDDEDDEEDDDGDDEDNEDEDDDEDEDGDDDEDEDEDEDDDGDEDEEDDEDDDEDEDDEDDEDDEEDEPAPKKSPKKSPKKQTKKPAKGGKGKKK